MSFNLNEGIAEYKLDPFGHAEGEENVRLPSIHPLPPIIETERRILPRGNPYDVEGANSQLYEDDNGQIYTATESGDYIPVINMSAGNAPHSSGGWLGVIGLIAGVVLVAVVAGAAEKK